MVKTATIAALVVASGVATAIMYRRNKAAGRSAVLPPPPHHHPQAWPYDDRTHMPKWLGSTREPPHPTAAESLKAADVHAHPVAGEWPPPQGP